MRKKIIALLTAALLFSAAIPTTVNAAGFVQDTAGVKYQNDDGTYAADSWVQVGVNIYHVDVNGIVQTGWIQVGGLWYFLDDTGICTNPEGTVTPPSQQAAEAVPQANPFAAVGWSVYTPTDPASLQNGVATGLIGFDGAQYWAAPGFVSAPAPAVNPQEKIVYVTNTGSKYHRDGCRYLRESKIPMNYSDAIKSYTPCSVCKP